MCFPLLCVGDNNVTYQNVDVSGTLIVASLDGSTEYIYGEYRSNEQFSPASTFKIPHSLIALEEKVITGPFEWILWDGKDKGQAVWNKDHTLGSAFTVSCVWCYQQFTKKINADVYRHYLQKMGYGNAKVNAEEQSFWLQGELAISAQRQIGFLRKLVQNDLPFKNNNIQLVKKIMIMEDTPEFILRGKTGWSTDFDQQLGWFVGYIETKRGVWLFAHNMDINEKSDLSLRKSQVIEVLKLKGIMTKSIR